MKKENKMTCKLCSRDNKNPTKCGWVSDIFNDMFNRSNNNCSTLINLRDLCLHKDKFSDDIQIMYDEEDGISALINLARIDIAGSIMVVFWNKKNENNILPIIFGNKGTHNYPNEQVILEIIKYFSEEK